ncbi:MAG: CRISPR-associated helicase Cas3' [Thermosynechococcaceae cyanobacterium]
MQTRFWAKTGSGNFENGKPQYHPVICHLADTAAVAMEIVRNCLSPVAVHTLERGLGLTGESLVKCCGFFAGSHDLGKVSPAFQFQVDPVGKALAGGELYDLWHHINPVTRKEKAPHGLVTAKTLPEFLIERSLDKALAKRLAAIVGGHHGFFPSATEIKNLNEVLAGANEGNAWRKYSREIFEQLESFVALETQDLPTQCDNAAAMILAGLTTVSDWIASNPDEKTGFRYANDRPFKEYADELPKKAKRALEAIGWTKLPTGQPLQFTELFKEITEPRELQKAAISTTKTLTAPCLILVEASMGEGKTEAALYLADHLQHQAATGGFYIGLPTQATSNAMWNRVRKFLGHRYSEETVNLTLSHSAAALQDDYQSSICRLDQVYDQDGKVVAGEWHTARKRTLLSPYGVGTIDQALMGTVRSKHQFVRLFGLAGRVVILDEIHAYDLYTSTLLERFLEWLALLGSPVIALSATLPTETRRRLVNAYAKGCGSAKPEMSGAEYPRLTVFTPQGLTVIPFNASAHVTRSLNLQWVKDKEWAEALCEKLSDGGCATVICSTVGRAQEVFQRLQKHFDKDELGLFHGRFLFVDRDRIEKDCIAKFGKPHASETKRPNRYVLVATQVIEQSLDLDFDLMISDIAPVDLLLQRSGRLHRHEERQNRPEKLKNPTMWLIAPELSESGQTDFGNSGFIYDRHVLLRSWLTLRHQTHVQLPEMMDSLIEAVYNKNETPDEALEPVYQEDWHTSLSDYLNDESQDQAKADAVKLPPGCKGDIKPSEFTRLGDVDDDSAIAKVTRLGRESVTTIFLQQTAEGLVLPNTQERINLKQTPDLKMMRRLLEHSTRISKMGLVNELKRQEQPPRWTSALLRHCRLVVLDEGCQAQVGKWEICLDIQKGVVIASI